MKFGEATFGGAGVPAAPPKGRQVRATCALCGTERFVMGMTSKLTPDGRVAVCKKCPS